jgi:hypothetical protein
MNQIPEGRSPGAQKLRETATRIIAAAGVLRQAVDAAA